MATRSFLRLKLVAAVQKRQFALVLVDPVALNACYARCVARARAAAPGCGGPPLSTDLSQDRQYARARARAGGLWVSLPSAFVETCSSPAASVLPHVPPPSARALTLTLSAGLSVWVSVFSMKALDFGMPRFKRRTEKMHARHIIKFRYPRS